MNSTKLVFMCLLLACFARFAVGNNKELVIVEEAMDEIIVVYSHKQYTEKLELSDYYRVYFIRNGQVMATRRFKTDPNSDLYCDERSAPIWSSIQQIEKDKIVPYFVILFDETGFKGHLWIKISRHITAKQITFMTTDVDPFERQAGMNWWNQNRNMRDLKQP